MGVRSSIAGLCTVAAALLLTGSVSGPLVTPGSPLFATTEAAVVSLSPRADKTAAELEDDGSTAAEALARPDAVLVGLEGAAIALAAKDGQRAIELVNGMSAAAGTDLWFTIGAIEGRARRLLGQPAQAAQALLPRVEHRRLANHFPADVLTVEYAQALLEVAREPEGERADGQARRVAQTISLLTRRRRQEPVRTAALMQVLAAQLAATLPGPAGARRAVKAMGEVLRAYPNHPQRGELWLEYARALERSGRGSDAVRELRKIAIERNGEPEGLAAWQDLEQRAQTQGRALEPLSPLERLASASAARRNRRVELSRALLDELVADPAVPETIRAQASASRSVTAAKQRDYQSCVDERMPVWNATHNVQVRAELLKCLERSGHYDEAIALWLREADGRKSKSARARAQWEAVEMALRGAKYSRAQELLVGYEKLSKGHSQTRAWLSAYLALRLGDRASALAGFRAYAAKYRGDRLRARYFLGRLLAADPDKAARREGVELLTGVSEINGLGYYGLMARQRLLDVGERPPAPPSLRPVAEETDPPRRPEAQAIVDGLAAKYGLAWPPLSRAQQLYRAGYNDEARRELRVMVAAMYSKGRKLGGPRNEDILVGTAWKPTWTSPRVAPTKAGRKTLRDRDAMEELREGLRQVAFTIDEPHTFIKLSDGDDGGRRERWSIRAFRPAVEREARLRSIDAKHLWALMYTESRFRPHVVSPVGARGALQIMPWTAHQLAERLGEVENGHFFDADRLFDIDTNAHLAAYYVAELLQKFHGQAPFAYASYNGGPSNVARWLLAQASSGTPTELDTFIEEIPFRESQRYVKRVMEIHATYGLLYDGRLPRWTNAVDPSFEDNIDF